MTYKEFLLTVIAVAVVLLVIMQGSLGSVPEYKDCPAYGEWQTRFVPARCLNHFITTTP